METQYLNFYLKAIFINNVKLRVNFINTVYFNVSFIFCLFIHLIINCIIQRPKKAETLFIFISLTQIYYLDIISYNLTCCALYNVILYLKKLN